MRKRGFKLKGFSTGNGKTSKPMMTGRQFGSRGDSPLFYSPDGTKPNPPRSSYVDEEAQDAADDLAHGGWGDIDTSPQVDAGMPAVEQQEFNYMDHLRGLDEQYSEGKIQGTNQYRNWGMGQHNLTTADFPGSEEFDPVSGQSFDELDDRTKRIIYERRMNPNYNAKSDKSHASANWNPNQSRLTQQEKQIGGFSNQFATSLDTTGDRESYNQAALRHATGSDAWKNTGTATYTMFDPVSGKRTERTIQNPNFKPHSEQKVTLDKKSVGSVGGSSTTTKKPVRSTQTQTTKTTTPKTKSTKTTGGKKSTGYSDAYKKRDKKLYGDLSEAEYTAEAKRQKAHHAKTGKWDAPTEAMKSKEKKK